MAYMAHMVRIRLAWAQTIHEISLEHRTLYCICSASSSMSMTCMTSMPNSLNWLHREQLFMCYASEHMNKYR